MIRNDVLLGPHLSPRELQTLEYVSQGMPDKRIAAIMGISVDTIKNYNFTIARKLGTQNRTSSVVEAYRLHILQFED
jgi:DNA-binding CsgD family transcriptional regulator